MTIRVSSFALLIHIVSVTAGAAPVIFSIGPVVDTSNNPCGVPTPMALSAGGGAVCGLGCNAFVWSSALGMQNPGAGWLRLYAISSSGTIAVGDFGSHAARLLPGNVVQDLGTIPPFDDLSTARGVSADGSVVAGISYNTGAGQVRGFRWQQSPGVMQALVQPAGIAGYGGSHVSGDGSAIVGYGYTGSGTACIRWRVGPPPDLMPQLPGTNIAVASATDPSGTVVVGYSTFNYTTPLQPFRWAPGNNPEELFAPPLSGGAVALDTTPGGLAVVGKVIWGPNPTDERAAFWNDSYGWTDLNDYLPALGINMNGWVLHQCGGVSDDGTTIMGTGTFNNSQVTWIARNLPSLCGPRIDVQPVDTTKCAHAASVLYTIATSPNNSLTLLKRWYKRVPSGTGFVDMALNNGVTPNGSTLSGAFTTGLTIANTSMADAGEYFCRLTGGCATTDTDHVILTVLPNLSGNGGPIGTADLVLVLGNFGNNVQPYTSGDVNGDGVINTADLTIVLGNFGVPCP